MKYQDLTLTIEELHALAEVFIPAIDLNDPRKEVDEYLAQTASDLHDRVTYMVRTQPQPTPQFENLRILLQCGPWSAERETWLPTRTERREWLKTTIQQLHRQLLVTLQHLHDIEQEEAQNP